MRRIVVGLLSLTLTFALASAASAGPIAYSVQSNGNDHLYSIDLATGIATDLGLVGLDDAEGLTWVGGTLYGIGGTVGQFWDLTTAPGAKVGDTGPRSGTDAGLAATSSGEVYNVQGAAGATSLYTINTATGAATLVGGGAYFADSLAINGAGAAYGVDAIFADSLYSVNLSTGAGTLIGSLGLGDVSAQTGADFDALGTLWMIFSSGSIYTVNTTTGHATFVSQARTATGATLSNFEGLAIRDTGAAPVPEPASLALLGLGLLGVAVKVRRSRQQ